MRSRRSRGGRSSSNFSPHTGSTVPVIRSAPCTKVQCLRYRDGRFVNTVLTLMPGNLKNSWSLAARAESESSLDCRRFSKRNLLGNTQKIYRKHPSRCRRGLHVWCRVAIGTFAGSETIHEHRMAVHQLALLVASVAAHIRVASC